jgi:hypothetical protein
VGFREIDHFDGRKWLVTPGPPPNPQGVNPQIAIAGLRHGPLYAAGSTANSEALVLRWTRNRWIRVRTPLPKAPSLFQTLAVRRDGDVWAGGFTYSGSQGINSHDRPLIEHYVRCG